MTAAERAAAAAARVPDPAPRPRRIKRKSLSWKSEAEMTAVRWFRKVRRMPSSQPQKDVIKR